MNYIKEWDGALTQQFFPATGQSFPPTPNFPPAVDNSVCFPLLA